MEGGGSKKVHLLGTSPKRGISCQNIFSFFFVWHIAVKFWGHTLYQSQITQLELLKKISFSDQSPTKLKL